MKNELKDNEIEIRYVEQYTVQVATQPIVLNMDEFKNCDPRSLVMIQMIL